jgi:hypothetical protein
VFFWLRFYFPTDLLGRAECRTKCSEQLPQTRRKDTTPQTATGTDAALQFSKCAEGSVALFTTVDKDVSAAELVVETAQCLAMRGEAVLVIETERDAKAHAGLAAERTTKPNVDSEQAVLDDWTGANRSLDPLQPITTKHAPRGAHDGLADLLRNGDLVASDVVRPAAQFDLLLAGETSLPAEAFASRRLSELLGELRHRYSTILILGPGVEHAVDLEMLAARSTSMIFCGRAGAPRRLNHDAEERPGADSRPGRRLDFQPPESLDEHLVTDTSADARLPHGGAGPSSSCSNAWRRRAAPSAARRSPPHRRLDSRITACCARRCVSVRAAPLRRSHSRRGRLHRRHGPASRDRAVSTSSNDNTRQIGQGLRLDFGVRQLKARNGDVVVIVDADCTLGPGTLNALAADCAQTGGRFKPRT